MNLEKLFIKNMELWAKTCPKQAVMLPYVNCNHVTVCKTKKGEPNLECLRLGSTFPIHSPKGAADEAKAWFKALPLRNVPLVCVYGVGLGYFYDAITAWLKKDRSRHLVFLEDDLAVIHRLFETPQGMRILEDPQVQLLYFDQIGPDEAMFEGLYWNFAMTRLAVTALDSYKVNCGSVLAELRHKIAYDAAMKNALVDEYMRYGANYYINFYRNMLSLEKSYFGNAFFGKFPKVPAIICGAGPSLAKNLPLVKTLMHKAVVFAGGSALNVLNAAGFKPHFGAGIDPNPAQFTRLSESQGFEVPFFYRNRMFHDAFELIHGPRLYITGSGGYDTAGYFEKKLGIEGGETLDEGHNVVNFCVEVANAMGCDPIIFVGMDLAFTGMHAYAPGVVEETAVNQSEILEVEDEDSKAIVKNDIYGQPTYTLWKWVAESEWIGDYAKTHPMITLINCTEGGLGFPGVANRPLAEASKELLLRPHELKDRIHGETQNSALPGVTTQKVIKIMHALSKSLERTNDNLSVLADVAKETIARLKAGNAEAWTSGKGALAETELAEEPAYKYILEVFNEVYAHILSGDVHEIQVRRYTDRQRQIKRQELAIRKFTYLTDVSTVNAELIAYALREHKKRKTSPSLKVEVPKTVPGTYRMQKGRLQINDPEIGITIDVAFEPVKIPKAPKDGAILKSGHCLRVFFDQSWKLCECYAEIGKKPDGQGLLYYPDGKIKAEVFYQSGKLHGPSKFWSQQGKLLAESWYVDGRLQGKSHWYYPSGKLYSLQRYKDGEWHGHQEYYFPDGKIKTLLAYHKGKLTEEPVLETPNLN